VPPAGTTKLTPARDWLDEPLLAAPGAGELSTTTSSPRDDPQATEAVGEAGAEGAERAAERDRARPITVTPWPRKKKRGVASLGRIAGKLGEALAALAVLGSEIRLSGAGVWKTSPRARTDCLEVAIAALDFE